MTQEGLAFASVTCDNNSVLKSYRCRVPSYYATERDDLLCTLNCIGCEPERRD